MSTMIIYGSKYGTARRYAEELARRLGQNAVSYQDVKRRREKGSGYETVVYFGSLYAGGVTGLSKTIKSLSITSGQKLVIATVGLADPDDTANAEHIKTSIRQQISGDIFCNAAIIHLRGGIDYQKLSFLHKAMMKLFYTQLKKQPTETRTAETQTIIDTYGQTVDFINFDTLTPIMELL